MFTSRTAREFSPRFTADGKLLWKHSMMEEFGRMTFPNNRTASPLIDKDLVITRGITTAWGAYGPPGDRFYAFDKKTGELVWSSAPGALPQDNTFSHPWLSFLHGKRVLYSAGGDSSLVCLNARTGEPLFRTPVAKAGAKGGINAAVLEYKGNIIVVHESENIDTSEVGRMAAFKIPAEIKPPSPQAPQVFETKELEQWRNPVGALASSPVLVGDRIYQVSGTGDLAAINAADGKVLWKKKLGIEQRQSSPFYADGKLYIAMYVAAAERQGGGGAAAETGGRRRTLRREAGRQGRGNSQPHDPHRQVLRLARRLQRQALHPDREEALLLRQEGKEPRSRRRSRAGEMAGAGREEEAADRALRSVAEPGRHARLPGPRARCEWLHRGGQRRSEVGEVGAVHSADRAGESRR